MNGKTKKNNYNSRGAGKDYGDTKTAGKGNNRRSRKQRSDRDEHTNAIAKYNDFSWYNRNPNLLAAAANLPFPYRPGMTVPAVGGQNYNIPGVMVLDWMPSVGNVSEAPTDPVSVTAKEIYSRVRAAFSGSLDADAPDFMIYLMGLDSMFSYIAWLKRLYRLLSAWTPENYALPDQVLSAIGISQQNAVTLRQNKKELWQIINELVLQTRKFTCPASMDIFNRHYWMNDNVYADAPTINSQFYVFNQVGYFQYYDHPEAVGFSSALKMVKSPTITNEGSVTVSTLYNFGLGLINAFVKWDDAYLINGYLKRAYESSAQFIVDELPEQQPFSPVYEELVLSQIENSRPVVAGYQMLSNSADWKGLELVQIPNTNTLVWKPTFFYSTTANQFEMNAWNNGSTAIRLNLRGLTTSEPAIVEATRLMANWQGNALITPPTGYSATMINCATEIPVCWRYLEEPIAGGSTLFSTEQLVFVDLTWLQPGGNSSSEVNYPYYKTLTQTLKIDAFDWHPIVMAKISLGVGTANADSEYMLVGDVSNVTAIQKQDLQNLHRVCVFSEFNSFDL